MKKNSLRLSLVLTITSLIVTQSYGWGDSSSTNELIKYINLDQTGKVTVHEGYYNVKSVNLSTLKTDQSKENANKIDVLNHSKASKSHEDWQDGRLSHLREHAHENRSNISANKQAIDRVNKKVNKKVKHTNKKVKKNSRRPDQIQNGSVSGSTLSITEKSRRSKNTKTTNIDMSGLVTTQGTTNSQEITVNRNRIQDNSNTIIHNAGGVVNGTTIKSNKDLTKVTQENWQQIQINAGDIQYNTNWNTQQQQDIDYLLGQSNHNTLSIRDLQYQVSDLTDYTMHSTAGLTALSTVDFAGYGEDTWEVGFGVGTSHSNSFGSKIGGAVGIKYGVDDNTNLMGKGWFSGSDYGAAIGATFRF
jgi:hypothetical protein